MVWCNPRFLNRCRKGKLLFLILACIDRSFNGEIVESKEAKRTKTGSATFKGKLVWPGDFEEFADTLLHRLQLRKEGALGSCTERMFSLRVGVLANYQNISC